MKRRFFNDRIFIVRPAAVPVPKIEACRKQGDYCAICQSAGECALYAEAELGKSINNFMGGK